MAIMKDAAPRPTAGTLGIPKDLSTREARQVARERFPSKGTSHHKFTRDDTPLATGNAILRRMRQICHGMTKGDIRPRDGKTMIESLRMTVEVMAALAHAREAGVEVNIGSDVKDQEEIEMFRAADLTEYKPQKVTHKRGQNKFGDDVEEVSITVEGKAPDNPRLHHGDVDEGEEDL